MVAAECSRKHFMSEKYRTVRSQAAFPSKWHASCICTLLTVKMLETFLEAILWKPFQFFLRIRDDFSSILQRRFQSREQLQTGQYRGRCSVGTVFFLVRNPWPKRTGVLEHCRERETDCWFCISWSFLADRIAKATITWILLLLWLFRLSHSFTFFWLFLLSLYIWLCVGSVAQSV